MTQLSALTQHGAASNPPRISILRGLLHPTTLLALLIAATVSAGIWSIHERPVTPPDFKGRVDGLAFSPYHAGESAETGVLPTRAEIKSDLAVAAAQTDHIRTYTVAGEFAEIPQMARGTALKITLGAWLDKNSAANGIELARLITAANENANVERLMVGNETQFRGDLSVPQLIADINRVKAATQQPVSTAEPPYVWLRHPELARAVDVITVHLLPYWEGVPVQDAINQVNGQMAAIAKAYPGKPIVIGVNAYLRNK